MHEGDPSNTIRRLAKVSSLKSRLGNHAVSRQSDGYSRSIESNYLDSERYLKEVLQSVPLKEMGKMVQDHRKAMHLSIRDLAARAMVSKTSIVSLEQGKSCRPATLAKICTAMNLHLERFILPPGPVEDSANRIHSSSQEQWFALDALVSAQIIPASPEDRRLLHGDGTRTQLMMFKNVPSKAGFIAGIIELSEATKPRSHSGREFIYVLRGRANVIIGDRSYILGPGDAVVVLDFENHSYGPAPEEVEPVSLLCFRVG
ncbi:MAG: XRE family transcriptional regulator [Fimbriimonadaceae bacterium]